MVRWRESVLYMEAQGVAVFETGAGKALAGMIKRIAQQSPESFRGHAADIEALLKTI